MKTIHVSTIDAKAEFSDIINRVSHHQEHIILTRRGKEIAAIIPIEDYSRLQQNQNQNDLHEAVDALQEARSEGSMALETFKAGIG
jgi:prevent-host-death family protein